MYKEAVRKLRSSCQQCMLKNSHMKLPVDMPSFLRKSSNNEKFVQSYRNSIHSRIK